MHMPDRVEFAFGGSNLCSMTEASKKLVVRVRKNTMSEAGADEHRSVRVRSQQLTFESLWIYIPSRKSSLFTENLPNLSNLLQIQSESLPST